MKTTLPLLLRLAFALFCLLPAHFAAAAPASAPPAATIKGLPVIVKANSVSLDASAYIDEKDNNPAFSGDAVTPFTALLKAYPHVHFVHIGWEDSVVINSEGKDILYDRARHTLTVSWYYGGQGDATFGAEVRFRSVRESVFAAILNTHPKGFPDSELEKITEAHPDYLTNWDGFQLLYQPRYGCRSRIVRPKRKISE